MSIISWLSVTSSHLQFVCIKFVQFSNVFLATDVKLIHLSNAFFPICVTLLGIVIDVKLVQPLNASLPIVTNCSGKFIFFSFLQFMNARSPIILNFEFPLKTTSLKFSQFLNASLSISSTLSGITIDVKFLYSLKTPYPIFVTLFGTIILNGTPIPENTLAFISCTPFLISITMHPIVRLR